MAAKDTLNRAMRGEFAILDSNPTTRRVAPDHGWVVQMVDESGERVIRTYQAAGMTERDAEIFCDRKQRQYPTKFFQMARREG